MQLILLSYHLCSLHNIVLYKSIPLNYQTKQIMNKRLYRIKGRDSKLAGVALGLAEYFDIDVTIVRVAMVGLFFTPVPVVIPYLVLWIFLPKSVQLTY